MVTTSPRALVEAVTKIWPSLESAFGTPAEWQEFSSQLLRELRVFDDPAEDTEAIALRIVTLFASHPPAQEVLTAALAERQGERTSVSEGPQGFESPAKGKHGGQPAGTPKVRVERWSGDAIIDIPTRCARVNVLFGTDRVPVAPCGQRLEFSAQRAEELSFGIASVSIPDDRRKGRLERPRWYLLEFRENLNKHVVIVDLRPLTRADFIVNASAVRSREASRAEALIFVHGYNVSFEEAIRRTGQLAYDLEFRGIAIAYSWPSEGQLFGYGADARTTESSVWLFREFIQFVQTRLGLNRVNIIAHSMGSRLLSKALEVLTPTAGPGSAEIVQLVFAAPDVDRLTFERLAKAFTQNCKRCTLYSSSRDLALFASRLIYRLSRAGQTSVEAGVRGVDSIDATKVDTSLMGHSYFGDRRTILADLFELFESGRGPEARFGLKEIPTDGGRYWEFVR